MILARHDRRRRDDVALAELVTKHVVGVVAGSSMGAKRGTGEKAAASVRFLADEPRTRKELPAARAVAMFGAPEIPEGMTAAEVSGG